MRTLVRPFCWTIPFLALTAACSFDDGGPSLTSSASLVPSWLEEEVRHRYAVSAALAGHVNALPAVHASHVFVDIAVPSPLTPFSVEGQLSERRLGSISVIATVYPGRDMDMLRDQILELVASSVSGVPRERIAVALHEYSPPHETASERLVSLGPFQVAESSRTSLMAMAVSLLVLVFALAVWAFCAEHINASLRERLARVTPGAGLLGEQERVAEGLLRSAELGE